MFCIALLLLLLQFFGSCGYSFKVGGQEFLQVDLLDKLKLHNTTYQGIKLGKGIHSLSPSVAFSGDYRDVFVTGDWVNLIRSNLGHPESNEFTISLSVKQNSNNVGTLLAFSTGLISALEIQSSGRKNEVRVISNSMVQAFPLQLADGSWHRLAVSFSATQVDIFLDCSLVVRRVLQFDPAVAISSSPNTTVWIGQKAASHFLFQGVMQDVRVTFGPYGYLSQCPQMDTQCPTCSDYNALKISFASLQSQIESLTRRLSIAESRLSSVEECECQKSCKVNSTWVVPDGNSWLEDCEECACKKGEIVCQAMQCPAVSCKNPVTIPGKCCPTCLDNCTFRGRTYQHGEVESGRNIPMECGRCECNNGNMHCKKEDPEKICPPLSCPPSEQIVVSEQCCKVCPGTDYCAIHRSQCHANATCVNLQTTFTCHCHKGFSGDGLSSCEDIDECLLGHHHCTRNSACVNTEGGYECECSKGFKKVNNFQCEDRDECADGSHKCHQHATCTNTRGSYHCTCKDNYEGDGYHCAPQCNRTCENGGLCIAPNVCSCRSGWTGGHCETDVNECLNSRNNTGPPCPKNAVCINKPGWHLCQCKEGFQLVLNHLKEGHCEDVNECEDEKACADGLMCINTEGSFECRCPEGNPQCSAGCIENDVVHQLGSQWISEDCQLCTCMSPGTSSCVSDATELCTQHCSEESNIVLSDSTHRCCSTCNQTFHYESHSKLKSCRHELYPDIEYQSGETWYSNCQTCECLNGETDCWSIDCPPVNCHNAYLQPGDCCYRCPGAQESRPEDRCTHWHKNGTFSECHLLQDTIQSGTRVTLPHSNCISCKCQDGELCCSYDYDCVAHKADPTLLTTSKGRNKGSPTTTSTPGVGSGTPSRGL